MLLSLVLHMYSMCCVLPAAVLLGTAPTYVLAWGAWRLLSAFLPSRFYQAVDDRLYCIYQSMVLFFFENCTGVQMGGENMHSTHRSKTENKVRELIKEGILEQLAMQRRLCLLVSKNLYFLQVLKILLYGDLPKNKENIIYLANHQSTVDWIVADMLAIRQNALGHVRYVLKDGLKWLPLYGCYFSQMYLVIFPEGTRYNPELTKVISASQTFAAQEEFLCKECPKIHIHIDRIDKKDVPEEQVYMKRWLHERFEIKDKLLIEFYDSLDPERRNKFPGESVNSKLSLKKTLPSFLILSGLTAGMLMTEAGRKLYVKTWIYGTLIGCLWVSIKA
ncbi:1-acyl-sn-glycerol-3-phosphate acyltransferase epsilon isoform X5 [Orcinus orca]|uniref:1-acyl-sn-glycerol-3-phosphate acyltransferase epsilon isoform X5 n=1 Tax=Orcinus orca TaxID=9733 RepID=UPI001441218D|nr:1-acyl-sn-glycerol-3-phosphate acyltransferase epsilon isoform X5 [Orcinus orca]